MEYITIAEFAERAGVTPQAVYKRLKTDLEPFLKVENGVKLLNADALELYTPTTQSKREKELLARIEELEVENQRLKEENHSLLVKLTANNDKLLELLENQQILLAQNQQVQQSLLNPPATVEEVAGEVDNSCIELEPTVTNPGLFGWFRKRKRKVN